MEIPRNWREQPTNTRFGGRLKEVEDKATGRIDIYFKYPGGEVPFLNAYDFVARLVDKGFGDEEIGGIVNLFLRNTVATEASVPMAKVLESVG